MCTIFCLTPVIIASWPLIEAIVIAAVGTMGFTASQEVVAKAKVADHQKTREEIEIKDSEILQSAGGTGEKLVVEREGVRAVFSRDGRSCLRVSIEGDNVPHTLLRQIGEELVGRVTQQYVYDRLLTELKQQRNMTVVEEDVIEDRAIRIHLRNW